MRKHEASICSISDVKGFFKSYKSIRVKTATRSVHFLIYKEGLLGFCKS